MLMTLMILTLMNRPICMKRGLSCLYVDEGEIVESLPGTNAGEGILIRRQKKPATPPSAKKRATPPSATKPACQPSQKRQNAEKGIFSACVGREIGRYALCEYVANTTELL
jgi:hypothetical protein